MRVRVFRYDTLSGDDYIYVNVYDEQDKLLAKKISSVDKYCDSHCMYTHVVADILHEVDSNWQYDVDSEYIGDDWDKMYTCTIYHKHKRVLTSSYNEYNGCGENVSIKDTIDLFAKYGVEVDIHQENGGWCEE